MFKSYIKKDSGLGTVEIVILIAVLVIVALIFKDKIIDFVNELLDKVLDVDKVTEDF